MPQQLTTCLFFLYFDQKLKMKCREKVSEGRCGSAVAKYLAFPIRSFTWATMPSWALQQSIFSTLPTSPFWISVTTSWPSCLMRSRCCRDLSAWTSAIMTSLGKGPFCTPSWGGGGGGPSMSAGFWWKNNWSIAWNKINWQNRWSLEIQGTAGVAQSRQALLVVL